MRNILFVTIIDTNGAVAAAVGLAFIVVVEVPSSSEYCHHLQAQAETTCTLKKQQVQLSGTVK